MPEQRGADWAKSASAEAIRDAMEKGELAHYLGGKTDVERGHDAVVSGTPNRLLAEAYGFESYGQMTSASNHYGSSMLALKRQEMSPEQVQKLDWLSTATPAEVYAAEQRGELDALLRRDVANEAARLDAIRASVTKAMTA